mmetsp:Transcript_6574/g.21289  ORF Transcript_6574/g.21289 Transcript_6574/m.21289 type:complete len:255 (+) Transcript_6574:1078-1842(+)
MATDRAKALLCAYTTIVHASVVGACCGGGLWLRELCSNMKVARKVEPTPGSESTDTVPPISPHNSLQMNRPRPVPPYERVGVSSTCENCWKSFRCPRWSMPMPLSRTATCHNCRFPPSPSLPFTRVLRPASTSTTSRAPPSFPSTSCITCDTDTSTSPCSVNLSAFDTKLCTTCRMRVGSPITHGFIAGSTLQSKSRCFCTAVTAFAANVCSSTSDTENSTVSNTTAPASIFDTSRMSLTIRSKTFEARVTPAT